MNRLNVCFCGLLLVAVTVSCSMMKDSKAAEPAIAKFHTQFNAKKFAEIYDESSEQMKDSSTQQEFIDVLEAVYGKLGTVESSTSLSWNVNSGPLTSIVTAVYDTKFSDGKGSEQFIFSVSGDKVQLVGYNINSKDLILK